MVGSHQPNEANQANEAPDSSDVVAELARVRLESDTLYEIVGIIAGSAEVPKILAGVVDLLTEATGCHGCFIYLREGDRLRLRAASRAFSQVVDQVQIPVEEGLVGWAVRTNHPAVAENAFEDPRFVHVPELSEEQFRSMIAVAIPARSGAPIGAISLHAEAPREFSRETVNFLVHTASLIAGAVETAQLYEEANLRVRALTTLSQLSEEIAAAASRDQLYATVTNGAVALFDCAVCELYEGDADPETDAPRATAFAEGASDSTDGPSDQVVAPIVAGEELLGTLRARGLTGRRLNEGELLGAIANQTAVALKRAHLIERMTEEYVVRDFFAALAAGRADLARALARKVRFDLDQSHVLVHAIPAAADSEWMDAAEAAEARLRSLGSSVLADVGDRTMRALLAQPAESLADLDCELETIARSEGLLFGRSELHRGVEGACHAWREAADTAAVIGSLGDGQSVMGYGNLGVYRYLVRVPGEAVPDDRFRAGLRILDEYDQLRRTQLLETLECYLQQRGSVGVVARLLHVHPNTVRQRLDRIDDLTGIDLGAEDLLTLEIAVKLYRLHRAQ